MPFPIGSKRTAEKARKPKAGIPLDKKVLAQLLVEQGGNVSRAADRMGASRGAVSKVIQEDAELKELLRQCRERQLDELEKSCFERAIETQDTTLQIFLLKTQGKSRGYEQHEAQYAAQDIATAAFEFIINKSKNPAESK